MSEQFLYSVSLVGHGVLGIAQILVRCKSIWVGSITGQLIVVGQIKGECRS